MEVTAHANHAPIGPEDATGSGEDRCPSLGLGSAGYLNVQVSARSPDAPAPAKSSAVPPRQATMAAPDRAAGGATW